jgi:altronate dehydratase
MANEIKLTGYRRENGRVGVRNYVVVIPVTISRTRPPKGFPT